MIFEKSIVKMYSSVIRVRHDPSGDVFYFSHRDFDGLCAEPIKFRGNKGQLLRGYVYYYGDKRTDRLIIFEHGLGNGHVAYMKEIERIAREGYTVLSYDHTGCLTSEGESVMGLAQSLADLDFCIRFIKSSTEFQDAQLSVIGHSWGGYSTLNISAIHPDLTHIVALSGFLSVRRMLGQLFVGPLRLYIPTVLRIERSMNPEYVDYDAVTSLASSSTKAMIIHSSDDRSVSKRLHFDVLRDSLSDRKNTYFLEFSDRAHNPTYTAEAVKYKNEFSEMLKRERKHGRLSTDEQRGAFTARYDWHRMTEQDEEIWAKIFTFLES